jgi:hypothetical protein
MKTARALLLCCMLAATGCQFLGVQDASDPSSAPRLLGTDGAAAKPAPRTIPVELVFVRFDEHDAALREAIWTSVDEQAVDDGLRRRLNANGLRAGIVTGHLPQRLAERIVPERVVAAGAPSDPLADDPAVTRRLLRLLPDRRSEILATAGLEELVLLEETDGQVRGGTFRNATGLFELKVRPAADGRVRLDLTPEIKHGPLERSWVGEEGMFRMEAGQRRHRREDLHVAVDLPEDAVFLVGCAGDQGSTIGDALLRDHGGNRSTMRLLVVRPQSRTVDPIFADEAPLPAGNDVLEIR